MSRRRVVLTWSARIIITAAILLALVMFGLVNWLTVDLPSPDWLYEHAAAPSTRIYDRNGRLLYEILDPHGGAHTPVPLDGIPRACIDATIATEDASFYSNPGVDGWAIARAVWINLQGGEILSGGSTITQQLARNLLLSPEERTQVTLERKLRESILAWRIARTYGKDEILTLYLNETYYGNLAYGLEAAAKTYFAKSAAELDLAECALLAGLPQSPAPYNPLENPQAAQERQQVVLGLMVKHGYITQEEADRAAGEDLQFASVAFPIEAPHFVMLVRGQLEREFGLEALYTQGLQVYTTLDLDAQHAAERIVRRRLAQLADTRPGAPPRNVNDAAVVALDPHTGEVLAMVGSPDYFDPKIDGAVNVAVATRQPGSSIKPITYAAAFDPTRPQPLTAATMMVDVRTVFITREGDPYVPHNYDREWHGPVLLRQALASSYNLVAVKVLDHVGIDAMAAQARAMGITTFDDVGSEDSSDRFGLALTLGGGEVRLLELTGAYGAFANGGYRVEPVLITRVEDSSGQVLKVWETSPGERVMDERVAYLISDILSDDFARISTFGEWSALNLTRPAAVKTGTTTDWRDNWTVGYTPDLVVGVWAGNANNEPMEHVSGVTGAAPMWHDVMEELHKGRPVREFVEPEGMVRVTVCADSGLLPQERLEIGDSRSGRQPARCAHTITELFIAGTEPTRVDDWHWTYTLDARNGLLAGGACPAEATVQARYTLYPAEAQDWVGWQGIPQPPQAYSPLCPGSGETGDWRLEIGERPISGLQSLVLTSPDPGGCYRLSPEIPAASQQLFVAVRPAEGVALRQVTLYVDGHALATLAGPPYQARWQMTPGTHTFWAVGEDVWGNRVESERVVIEVVE
ncbi:MAG: PBP1A family penicillin-binding protein [Anaerolineae bacterium]|nr:PBP1A family penicillin-binding protein [Anaerolineae bacterium]